MINLILSGCNGRMGKTITTYAKDNPKFNIVAGVDVYAEKLDKYPVYPDFDALPCDVTADVVVDFSATSGLGGILAFATARKLPLVIATTGHSVAHKKMIEAAAEEIAIFMSPNMSIGIYLMNQLAAETARKLKALTEKAGLMPFDIEIIEKHHHNKLDAPSGTALQLANSITDATGDGNFVYDRSNVRAKREQNDIGIMSLRGGTITGEHTVVYAGDNEIIELTHKAESSFIFAAGAMAAAAFLVGKQAGMYGMKDLVD